MARLSAATVCVVVSGNTADVYARHQSGVGSVLY